MKKTSCEQRKRKGKGKSPLASPLKEKTKEKEISTDSDSVFACACACAQGSASPTRSPRKTETETVDILDRVKTETETARPRQRIVVDAEFILKGYREDGTRNDPVQVAMVALKVPRYSGRRANGEMYDNPGLFRHICNIIGEEWFRDIVYKQWRENGVDGDPRSRAATFQAKLNRAKYITLNSQH